MIRFVSLQPPPIDREPQGFRLSDGMMFLMVYIAIYFTIQAFIACIRAQILINEHETPAALVEDAGR